MLDFLNGLPFYVAFPVLFVIVMCRANATYWVGRAAIAGAGKTRLRERLDGRHMRTAQKWITRWGPWAVVLCFLTIGIQTAVNLAAGAGKMPMKRYLPAVTLGSIIWALLYSLAVLAIIETAVGIVAGSPWAWLALSVVALGIVALVVIRSRRRKSPVRTDV